MSVDWQGEYPTTAALLKKWGVKVAQPAPAGPRPFSAPDRAPVPTGESTGRALGLGVRKFFEVPQPLSVGGKPLIKVIEESPPIQFSSGFAEGIWNVAKSLPGAAALSLGGWEAAIRNPEAILPGIASLVNDTYEGLVGYDKSKLSPAARSHVNTAIKSFEENPSRASGRLLAEAAMLLFPGKTISAAKKIAGALPKVGRGARAVEVVAPVARAVAPAVQEAATAAPALEVRGSFKAVVQRAQQEAEAARAARAAQKAVPAAPARPAAAAPAEVALERARAVEARPGAVPQAARPQVVAPSVAPAPRPEINLEEIQKIRNLKRLGYSADQIAAMSAEASEEILAKGIRGTGFKRVGGKVVPARPEVPVEGVRLAVAPAPASVLVESVPVAKVKAVSAINVRIVERGDGTFMLQTRGRQGWHVESSGLATRGEAEAEAQRRGLRIVPVQGPKSVAPAPAPEVVSPVAQVSAPSVSGIEVPAVIKSGVPAVGSPEARAAIEKVRAAEAARAKTRALKAAPRITSGITMERAGVKPAVSLDIPGARAAQNMVEIGGETIERAGYDAATQTLALKMRGEPHVRVWGNVPEDTYRALVGAEHPGQVFGKMVRGQPGMALTGEVLAVKATADRVAGMLAQGVDPKEIVKFIKSVSKDVKPDDFIAAVRAMYQVPKGPAEFGEWARAWRGLERREVAAAPAVEVAPVEAAAVREGMGPELVTEGEVGRGMHVVDPEVEKLAGGKDFIPEPIEGASEVKRLKFWHSLEEMADRVWPGFGESFVRVRTISQRTFAPIKVRLERAGYTRIKPGLEDRNLYDVIVTGRAAPVNEAIAQAADEVQVIQQALGQVGGGDIFRLLRHAIDPAKVEKLSAQQIAATWVKDGVEFERAIKSAEVLKNLVERGGGTAAFFRSTVALLPPYELLRPMKHVVASYLEKASFKIGIDRVFGSEEVLRRTVALMKHPDTRYLVEQLDRFLGYHRPISMSVRQVRDLGRLANSVAVTVLTPVTAVKQLSQVAISAMNLPAQDLSYGFVKMATMSGWRGARAEAAFLSEARELSGILIGELEDVTRFGKTAEWVSEKVAARVIKWTGIQAVDNFARGVAYWARRHELERLVSSAASGNVGATRRLLKAGFDPDLLRAGGRGTIDDEVRMLAKEFADKYNLRSDILSSPAYLSEPAWQFARGLNMFAINMSKLFYKEIVHPTLRPGSLEGLADQVLKMARLGGYGTLVGALVNRTERFMRGREQPQDAAAELAGAWGALGALGVFDRLLDGIVDKNGELLPIERWPDAMAVAFGKLGTTFVAGAGPSIIFGVPSKLINRPLLLTPGIGSLLQSWYDIATGR